MNAKAKNLQEDIKESAHKIWLAGLGALSAAEEEGGKLFDRLIERGSEVEVRGKKKAKKAKAKVEETLENAWDGVEEGFEAKVASVLSGLGVPTRDEIRTLTERVEQLAAKLESSAAPKKTTRRRTTKASTKSTAAKSRTAKAPAKRTTKASTAKKTTTRAKKS